jgi:hypothetical protein
LMLLGLPTLAACSTLVHTHKMTASTSVVSKVKPTTYTKENHFRFGCA